MRHSITTTATLPLLFSLALVGSPGCASKAIDDDSLDDAGEGAVGMGGGGDTGEPPVEVDLDELDLGIYEVELHRIREAGCESMGEPAPDAAEFAVAARYDGGGVPQVVILPCLDIAHCSSVAEETESGTLSIDPLFMFDTALSDGTLSGLGRDSISVTDESSQGECFAYDERLTLLGFGSEVLEAQSQIYYADWDLDGMTCIEDFDNFVPDFACIRRVDWRATLAAIRE